MIIRPITQSDITFLTSVRADFPDAWNEDMINSAFRSGNFYGFIAEETDNGTNLPVGFITYSVSVDTADLQDVFVLKDYRKRGIGGALVKEFIFGAQEKGAEKLFLEVRESNTVAQKLYLSTGFTKLSIRKKYYSDGENAIVLIKEL